MGKQWEQWQTIFWGLQNQITADGDCSHEIKTLAPWKKSYDPPRQHIKKQRHYFAAKVCLVKAVVSPVVMYGCESWTIKKAEHQRIDAFELWCWRRLLRVPWTARSIQSILKQVSPEYSLKDWCWSWNCNTLVTWCEELTHWKRPWCWERLKAGGEGDDREWDGWMTSPIWWTWVWASSRSWWWTRRPGVLQSMGLQRVGYDWATELNLLYSKSTILMMMLASSKKHIHRNIQTSLTKIWVWWPSHVDT